MMKHSYHAFISNYKFNYKNWGKFVGTLAKSFTYHADTAVYNRGWQKFRLFNSVKQRGMKTYQEPQNGCNNPMEMSRYVIQCVEGLPELKIPLEQIAISPSSPLLHPSPPPLDLSPSPLHSSPHLDLKSTLFKELPEEVQKIFNNHEPISEIVKSRWNSYTQTVKLPEICPFVNRKHNSNNHRKLHYYPKANRIAMTCHSKKCTQRKEHKDIWKGEKNKENKQQRKKVDDDDEKTNGYEKMTRYMANYVCVSTTPAPCISPALYRGDFTPHMFTDQSKKILRKDG